MISLRIHATERRSRANGPGVRFALWVQGCSLGCRGCFNPATHPVEGTATPVSDLVAAIAAEADRIEGVTVSGGEPFEQAEGLLALVDLLRRRSPALSILVFSGFRRAEIERAPFGRAILDRIDVLIDGRYQEHRRVARGLRGSSNQVVHLLTTRYRLDQIDATPHAEVVIGPDGAVRMSGVEPLGKL